MPATCPTSVCASTPHGAATLSTTVRGRCAAPISTASIAMDDSNYGRLRAFAPTPEAEAKVVRMMDYCTLATRYDHVPDPYYEGAEGFELVLDLLEDACTGLLRTLSQKHDSALTD